MSLDLQKEIEGIKESFMQEVKLLFGNNLLAAKQFEQEQPNMQNTFGRITALVGPEYTPKVLRLYADMLERLVELSNKYKSEMEGK